MNGLVVLLGLCLLLLLPVVALLIAVRVGFRLRVPPRPLEALLARKFPITRPLKPAGEVTLAHPRLEVASEADRLGIGADVAVSAFGGQAAVSGTVLLSGEVRFRPEDGSVFVDRCRVDCLEVAGLPSALTKLVGEVVGIAARELLDDRAVYRLREEDARLGALRSLVRDLGVRGGRIELSVGGAPDSLRGLVAVVRPGGRHRRRPG